MQFRRVIFLMLLSVGFLNAQKIQKEDKQTSSTTQDCVKCLASYSNKWCTSTKNQEAEGMPSSDSFIPSSKPDSSECSDDTEKFILGSKYFLGPADFGTCGLQSFEFTKESKSFEIASSIFGYETLCWYKLETKSSNSTNYVLSLQAATNVEIEIYTRTSQLPYEFLGTLTKDSEWQNTVDNNTNIWILVKPTSLGSYIKLTAESKELSLGPEPHIKLILTTMMAIITVEVIIITGVFIIYESIEKWVRHIKQTGFMEQLKQENIIPGVIIEIPNSLSNSTERYGLGYISNQNPETDNRLNIECENGQSQSIEYYVYKPNQNNFYANAIVNFPTSAFEEV